MSTLADKLDEARALIEKGWTRGEYKRTRGGKCSYCAAGALWETANFKTYMDAKSLLRWVVGEGVIPWNDRQKSKKPVIAAFKRAAELARGDTSVRDKIGGEA